ncbi:flagellar hook-length control protein FliK [Aeromonas sp. L_1B5_3]|uniref:flagellar hook-length control protein FliK n=1 Tax=Aeromonas sp. L_1B5_3 TaxID=1588629 RepID=UPI000B2F85A2|nr:flagellar hook-length control protein FliK [Aeromonas sp. L_1B5_3]
MIQFSGPEALAMPEQSGFTRLARQPEEQGGLFPPLDLLMEEGALAPATEEVKEEVEQDEPDEVADNAAARLDAFSNMPPPFLLHEVGTRAAIVSSNVAAATAGNVEAGEDVQGDTPSVSAALRALSAYKQPETDKSQPVMETPVSGNNKERVDRAATDFSSFMLVRPSTRSDDAAIREKTIASLQSLLGVERAGERESGVPDLKGIVSNQISAPAPKVAEYQWAPVKLAEPQVQWGQQLVDVLKDKVELQVNQQIKQAHIRLDPPELGRLELTVRVEGDRLNVQLNVTNPAVRDALIQSMERLRMSLAPHHAGGVEVNVGQGGGQGDAQGKWQQEKILAGHRQWQDEFETAGQDERAWLNTLV